MRRWRRSCGENTGHAGRLARPGDRDPEPVGADAGKERRVGVAILARRQRRLDRLGEHVREVDPERRPRLRRRRPQPDAPPGLVVVADAECSRQMRAARPTSRARGAAAGTDREQPHDGLHVFGGRRLELDRLLVRQPHALVPRRVRLDPVLLEHGRQVLDALADRLALAAGPRELAHELIDVLDAERVDAAVAEDGDDAAERDAVQDARRLGDVDACRAPLLACCRDGWSRGGAASRGLGSGTREAASSPATHPSRRSASRFVLNEPA